MVKLSGSGVVSLLAIFAAIVATMFVTYLFLVYAKKILGRIGPLGIDAVTRIVGFFCLCYWHGAHIPRTC